MSGPYAEAPSFCTVQTDADERRPHNATVSVPVSIVRRYCVFHEKYEVGGEIRVDKLERLHHAARKARWSKKWRDVLVIFVLGELIAIGALLLAGSALAAMR